jgi:hypothetical protein
MFNGDMFVFSKGSPYIFASRIGIVKLSIFNVKHYKKRKISLDLNFRLAVSMLLLIYALKKHNNCLPCPAFRLNINYNKRFIAEITLLCFLNFLEEFMEGS